MNVSKPSNEPIGRVRDFIRAILLYMITNLNKGFIEILKEKGFAY